ncbi:MAG TPA: hypothetical protein GXX75_22830 [Clostridiales bacterium]|nr:hypothetical protein [Clostridiales bacterium]
MFLWKRVQNALGRADNRYKESYRRGEGVIIHYTKAGEIILENTIAHIEAMIMNEYNLLTNMQPGDIDFEKVDRLENSHNAHALKVHYGFGIESFINGVAFVWWTLYPDGRYFEDEDGFGGENCNETTVYAYIDTLGRVIIPFQDMNTEEKKNYRMEAEQKVKSRSQG